MDVDKDMGWHGVLHREFRLHSSFSVYSCNYQNRFHFLEDTSKKWSWGGGGGGGEPTQGLHFHEDGSRHTQKKQSPQHSVRMVWQTLSQWQNYANARQTSHSSQTEEERERERELTNRAGERERELKKKRRESFSLKMFPKNVFRVLSGLHFSLCVGPGQCLHCWQVFSFVIITKSHLWSESCTYTCPQPDVFLPAGLLLYYDCKDVLHHKNWWCSIVKFQNYSRAICSSEICYPESLTLPSRFVY